MLYSNNRKRIIEENVWERGLSKNSDLYLQVRKATQLGNWHNDSGPVKFILVKMVLDFRK
jgi:hypothetical protein